MRPMNVVTMRCGITAQVKECIERTVPFSIAWNRIQNSKDWLQMPSLPKGINPLLQKSSAIQQILILSSSLYRVNMGLDVRHHDRV